MTRRRRPEWKKTPPINLYKLASIILVVLFVFLTPAFIRKLIIIQKIKCQTQFGDCPPEIIMKVEGYRYRNYKDLKKETQRILDESLLVDTYLIQYQIPSTLKIDLAAKAPSYAVKIGDQYFLIDSEGVVLEKTSKTILPFIAATDIQLQVAQKIAPDLEFALKLLKRVSVIYTIESAILDNSKFEIKLSDAALIKLPLIGNDEALAGAIRLIYSRLNEGKEGFRMEDVKEIDLRFKNPVIRKK